jgi:hypothetical protein
VPVPEHAGQVLSFNKPQLSTTPLERLAIERIGDGRAASLKVRRHFAL